MNDTFTSLAMLIRSLSAAQGTCAAVVHSLASSSARFARLRCRIFANGALAVAFVDDAETLQREPRLVVLDGLGVRHDQLGETAGGDDRGGTELRFEAVHDRVDLSAVSVDRTRL